MPWIYRIKQNITILRSLWTSFTRKIYVQTDFIFENLYDTYVKHRREITSFLLRFWTFFIGGRIQFGVTVRVCRNKMAVWAKKPRGRGSAPRILRILIRPPANFRQSFAYLWAILCEVCSQKSRIFSGTARFSSLYAGASRVPPRVLAVWAKTTRGQLLWNHADSILMLVFQCTFCRSNSANYLIALKSSRLYFNACFSTFLLSVYLA